MSARVALVIEELVLENLLSQYSPSNTTFTEQYLPE